MISFMRDLGGMLTWAVLPRTVLWQQAQRGRCYLDDANGAMMTYYY